MAKVVPRHKVRANNRFDNLMERGQSTALLAGRDASKTASTAGCDPWVIVYTACIKLAALLQDGDYVQGGSRKDQNVRVARGRSPFIAPKPRFRATCFSLRDKVMKNATMYHQVILVKTSR